MLSQFSTFLNNFYRFIIDNDNWFEIIDIGFFVFLFLFSYIYSIYIYIYVCDVDVFMDILDGEKKIQKEILQLRKSWNCWKKYTITCMSTYIWSEMCVVERRWKTYERIGTYIWLLPWLTLIHSIYLYFFFCFFLMCVYRTHC